MKMQDEVDHAIFQPSLTEKQIQANLSLSLIPKNKNLCSKTLNCSFRIGFEQVHEKTNNLGFRLGPTQTRLYSHSIKLEA